MKVTAGQTAADRARVLSGPRAERLLTGALAAVVVTVAVGTVWASLARPAYDRMADFGVYLGSADAVWAHRPLYGYTAANGDPFTYPPIAILPFLALAKLPVLLARLIWQAVCLGAVVVVAAVVVRRWPAPLRSPRLVGLLVALGLLVSAPVQSDLRFGQVSVVVIAVAFLDAAEVTPPRWRGALIGVAAAIKLTPLLFLAYLLLARRWWDAARAGAGFAAATGVGWLLLPADSRAFFSPTGLALSRVGDLASLGNQSLDGVLLRSGIPGPARPIVWLLLVVVIVGVGLVRAAALRRDGQLASAAALVGCASLAASPVSWTHHQVWSVIAAILLLATGGPARRAAGIAGLVIMTFSMVDVAQLVTTNNTTLFVAANARALFACLLCVFGFGAYAATRASAGSDLQQRIRLRPIAVLAAVAVSLAAFALVPLPEELARTVRPVAISQLGAAPLQDYSDAATIAGVSTQIPIPLDAALPVNYYADNAHGYLEGGVYRNVARLQVLAAPGGQPVTVPILRLPNGDGVFAVHYDHGAYLQLRAFSQTGTYIGEYGAKARD